MTVGDALSLSVAPTLSTGTGAFTYQWKKGSVNVVDGTGGVTGAKTNNLKIASVAAGDAGSYTVVITEATASNSPVTSQAAVVAVTAAPVPVITIGTQPAPTSDLTVGDALSLTVAATVTQGATLSYQWKKGSANATGASAKTANFTVASVATGDAGSYTCVVSATGGAADKTSDAAVVTVAPALANVKLAGTGVTGSGAAYAVSASSAGTPTAVEITASQDPAGAKPIAKPTAVLATSGDSSKLTVSAVSSSAPWKFSVTPVASAAAGDVIVNVSSGGKTTALTVTITA